ncbi:phage tail protein [Sphingomonas sp. 37zxx]|uniref:phage tail protein n=1 Tax=Sphingomonas sp. 37zxx TaxID=1550073 RepID=UPI00053BEEB8|nr:tail fiber protein [Sphingomonas sp. 37zxx]
MADPYIGEIKLVAFNFAPRGYLVCDGQLLPIRQFTTLFSVLSNRFGGDGRVDFALPNLQERVPIGQGSGPGLTRRSLGETAGDPVVSLSQMHMPVHSHALNGATLNPANPSQNVAGPAGDTMFGVSAPGFAYSDVSVPPVAMSPMVIASAGQNQPHENRQPFLALQFVIAIEGIYPAHD